MRGIKCAIERMARMSRLPRLNRNTRPARTTRITWAVRMAMAHMVHTLTRLTGHPSAGKLIGQTFPERLAIATSVIGDWYGKIECERYA